MMTPNSSKAALAAAAIVFASTFPASAHAYPAATAQAKIASVRYLIGTWKCAHAVGTFSGTYTTSWESILGDRWLKQTYDFPPGQIAADKTPVRAEYFVGYDARRQGWVRFGAMSNGDYFAIRMTDNGSGWSWKYVTFFKRSKPETPAADATFTKKSNSEYTVDGPTYPQNGTLVTEHHTCRKT
jgi:hypothetical protein